MSVPWPSRVRLGDVITLRRDRVNLTAGIAYKRITVRMKSQGVVLRDVADGAAIHSEAQFQAKAGQFVLSRIDARNGASGLVPTELDDAVVSANFLTFDVGLERLDPRFLELFASRRSFWEQCAAISEGTTNRVPVRLADFLALEIPLPPLAEQQRIVERTNALAVRIAEARSLRNQAAAETAAIVPGVSARLFGAMDFEKRSLREVADKRTGIAYRAEDFLETGDTPVVRLKELATKRPTVYLRNPDAYPNVWLQPGDIILAKTSFSTGAMCQWPGPLAVLNQNAIMLRAKAGVEQRFLFAWLGQQVSRYLFDHLADPQFYPYIREADLMRWLVPVPPSADQRRIVAYLDGLQEHVDALKRLQAETAAELDALFPAILDRAFKGQM